MEFHGVLADAKLDCDLFIGRATRQQLEHLVFPFGQGRGVRFVSDKLATCI